MKIWEIEEGREFKPRNEWATNKYKLKNGRLYLYRLRSKEWIPDESQFNVVYQCDFEYLPEKKYYLKLKPEMNYKEQNFLNYNTDKNVFLLENIRQFDGFKTQFTESEIEELIPEKWLLVCDRIEVEDE